MSSAPPRFTEVAAGICVREDGSYLVAQRPTGKVYAGYWEFPGGKLEAGEAAGDALVRELQEELGITPLDYYPWITRTHHYEHANVRLRFFRIRRWQGEFVCREFQQIAWQRPGEQSVSPMLPANGPILRGLSLPGTLGITQASDLGRGPFKEKLVRALSRGLRMVMLREKAWSETDLVAFSREVMPLIRAAGALGVLNGSPEAARSAGADGVHLSATRLMLQRSRPDMPWCGASCHDARELQQALDLGLDYAVLGSVLPTPSHPGQATLGWSAFASLLDEYPLPTFALGGMHAGLQQVAWQNRAHGMAMMRAAWADT